MEGYLFNTLQKQDNCAVMATDTRYMYNSKSYCDDYNRLSS